MQIKNFITSVAAGVTATLITKQIINGIEIKKMKTYNPDGYAYIKAQRKQKRTKLLEKFKKK